MFVCYYLMFIFSCFSCFARFSAMLGECNNNLPPSALLLELANWSEISLPSIPILCCFNYFSKVDVVMLTNYLFSNLFHLLFSLRQLIFLLPISCPIGTALKTLKPHPKQHFKKISKLTLITFPFFFRFLRYRLLLFFCCMLQTFSIFSCLWDSFFFHSQYLVQLGPS